MEGIAPAARVVDIGAGAAIEAVIEAAIAAAHIEIGAVIESVTGAATEAAPDVEQMRTKGEDEARSTGDVALVTAMSTGRPVGGEGITAEG